MNYRCTYLTIVVVATAVLAAFCLWGFKASGDAEEIIYAETMDEVKLLISGGCVNETINLWNGSDGIFYAFIPYSYLYSVKVRFYNIKDEAILTTIDNAVGEEYRAGEYLNIEYDKEYTVKINGLTVDDLEYIIMFKALGNNPVAFLNTDSGSIDAISADRSIEESGRLCICDDNGNSEYIGELPSVRVRGNSSFNSPKKSFAIATRGQSNILGLKEADKWYLLAKYDEITKIRDQLVNRYVGKYTDLSYPDYRYCNLFVNGDYMGLYLFCNRRNADFLDIDGLEKVNEQINLNNTAVEYISDDDSVHAYSGLITPMEYSGGYLIEVIPEDYETAFPAFSSCMGIHYSIKSPNNATVEEVEYIRNYINEMEIAIMSDDGINPVTGKRFSEYLDIKDYADYYMVKEGFLESDVYYNASIFLYKKPKNTEDELLHMGPVWDMDRSFGRKYNDDFAFLSDPEMLMDSLIYSQYLTSYEDVRGMIGDRLTIMSDWVKNDMDAEIENLINDMGGSYYTDMIRWPDSSVQNFCDTLEGSVEMMRDFMKRRIKTLSSVYLDGELLCSVRFVDESGKIYGYYDVKEGCGLKKIPYPSSLGAFFAGWKLVDGSYDVRSGLIASDTVFEARWIPAELVLAADENSIIAILEDTDIVMLSVKDIKNYVDKTEKIVEEEIK